MIPRPSGPFIEAFDNLTTTGDAVAQDKHVAKAWRALRDTDALTVINLVCHGFEANCLAALTDPNASPDRRQHVAGQVAAARALWEGISHFSGLTDDELEAAHADDDKVTQFTDASAAPPSDEPAY